MNWRLPLVISLAVTAAASCDQTVLEPPGDASESETPNFQLVQNNKNCAWNHELFNTCTGELMVASGCLHEMVTMTSDHNGEMHANFHFHLSNATAVGQTSGMVCKATGNNQWTDSFGPPWGDPPFVLTGMNRMHWVCPGPDNDFVLFERWHMTVLASGELKAGMGEFVTECSG